MFQFYGRRETSFVCVFGVSRKLFGVALRYGTVSVPQTRFPRHLEEGEFVLWMERDARDNPTGKELTLFVTSINGEHVRFEVVNGDPDEFWKQQVSEA
ncbi:hypothetical protein ACVSEE_000711 [Vibrio cholerae]